MNKKRNKNFNNGITLIALVITIVVLLILAGVAISAIVSDDGILSKAQAAKANTLKEERKELVRLSYLAALDGEGKLNEVAFKEEIQKNLNGATVTANKENDIVKSYTVTYEDFMTTIKVDGKFEEPQKPNESGKHIVNCDQCKGKKYVGGGVFFGTHENAEFFNYDTLYCRTHGFQSEWGDESQLKYCSDCNLFIFGNDLCSKCGAEGYDYENENERNQSVCILCAKNGIKQYFFGDACLECNASGIKEVSCVDCYDDKKITLDYCLECNSTDVIKIEFVEYGYCCEECGEWEYISSEKPKCSECNEYLDFISMRREWWCFECEIEYPEYSPERNINCSCGSDMEFCDSVTGNRSRKCRNCGEEAYYDFDMDYYEDVYCDKCINCVTCKDEKYEYVDKACPDCKTDDLIKVFVDSYYYCGECGNEIHTDENLEGTICTNCEWNGELSLEEDYDYKCSKCGTFELEYGFKMLCPDCGECWTCYDSGIVEVDVCEDCGKEEFEMVLEYEYMCWSCDYSKILPNQTTITCPNCDSECYYWETENLKCISCKGNVITEEKECPDCK